MSLSPVQRRFYFSGKRHQPKSEVERIGPWPALCELKGWNPKDNDKRHIAHEAIGLPSSLGQWVNRDFNHFLTYVERAWAAAHPVGRGVPAEPPRDRDRENVIHTIEQQSAQLGEPYVRKIASDLYGLGCWEEMPTGDLVKLRNTLDNRVRSKRLNSEGCASARLTSPKRQYEMRPPEKFAPRAEQPGLAGFVLSEPKPQPQTASAVLAATTGYEPEDDMPF